MDLELGGGLAPLSQGSLYTETSMLKPHKGLVLAAALVVAAPVTAVAFAADAPKAAPIPAVKTAPVAPAAASTSAPTAVVLVAEIGKGVSGTDIKNYSDLISRLKDNPDCYTFGTAADSPRDLPAMTALQKRNGVRMISMSYRNNEAAIEALMKAKVELIPLPYAVAAPYIKNAQMRPLVVFGSARIPEIKDIPTASEVMPGFVY